MKLLLINSNPDSSFAAFVGKEPNVAQREVIISKASDFPGHDGRSGRLQNPDKLIHCLDEVTRICSERKIDLEEIDAVSVIVGPGSFTGIRVGLSLAKGFADALEKKIIPINNFDLTLNRLGSLSKDSEYCVLIPAKLPEYYFSIMKDFTSLNEGCIELGRIQSVISEKTTIVGNFPRESVKNLNYFDYIDVNELLHQGSTPLDEELDSMISLSMKFFSEGKMYDPEEIKPLYIKDLSIRLQKP